MTRRARHLWGRALCTLAASLIALSLSGCGRDDRALKWTEEVLLPDGRKVVLTRYQEFKGAHELGDTPTESDYWLEFEHPETGEIVRWESDRDLNTLVLMIDRSTPLLLVKPWFGSSMWRLKCPNPPYLLFRYEAGKWQQVDVAQIPVRRLRVNVTYSPKQRRDLIRSSGHHLGIEVTQDSQHDYRPYVINFGLMTEQTFIPENCDRNRDYLIDR